MTDSEDRVVWRSMTGSGLPLLSKDRVIQRQDDQVDTQHSFRTSHKRRGAMPFSQSERPPLRASTGNVFGAVPDTFRRRAENSTAINPKPHNRSKIHGSSRKKPMLDTGDDSWTKKRRRQSQAPFEPATEFSSSIKKVFEPATAAAITSVKKRNFEELSFRPSFLVGRQDIKNEMNQERPHSQRRKRKKKLKTPLLDELRAVRFATTAAGARLRSGEFENSNKRGTILDPRSQAIIALDLDVLAIDFVSPNFQGLGVFAVCLRRLSRLKPESTLSANKSTIDQLVIEPESPLPLPASGFLLASNSTFPFKPGDTVRIYDPFLAPHDQVPILSNMQDLRLCPKLTVMDAQLADRYQPRLHDKDNNRYWQQLLPPVPQEIRTWATRLVSSFHSRDSIDEVSSSSSLVVH